MPPPRPSGGCMGSPRPVSTPKSSIATWPATMLFGSGVAGALRRLDLGGGKTGLDRFVVVRTASDLEDQRPGTTPLDLYELLHTDQGFAGYTIAVENEWRVGTVIAHAWTS